MKRIAHFIETDVPGGAEQVMLDLCLHIKNETTDCTPVVLTFGHQWTIEQCQQKGINHISLPYQKYFKKTVLLPLFGILFARWLKQNNIHLLHSHLFGPITGSALAAFLARIPHVGTLHDIHMIVEKPARIKLIKLTHSLGTRLITVSRQMNLFYKKSASLNTLKTIYNGIDTSYYAPQNHVTDETTHIVCIGRLVKLKQVDKIILACTSLFSEHNIDLTVVGDGPEMATLKKISEKHSEKIHFMGQQSNIRQYLQSADIFIQFSTTEGLSRSIIEASSSGLPCIVSDVGGNNEIVINEKTGYVIAADDNLALTDAIKKLAVDTQLRDKFSHAAREYAVKKFDEKTCNQQYDALYKQLFN